jgi:hypothetical protein
MNTSLNILFIAIYSEQCAPSKIHIDLFALAALIRDSLILAPRISSSIPAALMTKNE